MGLKAVLGGALLVIGLVAGPAAGAVAQDPVQLGGGHVVDQADVLRGEKAAIEKAAVQLYKDHNIDLYVVYVDTFTNPADAADWANETASQNNLGATDYVLAVATGSRQYYLSGDSSGPVSDDQLAQIERNQIEPKLRAGDWSGAAIGAANGLGDAVGGGGTASFWLVLVAILVVAGVIVFVVRSRSKKGTGRSEQPSAASS